MRSVEQRFWAKVDKSAGPDGCWLWTAATSMYGYGVFHPRKGKTIGAHRYALGLALGRPVEAGMYACHTCDNRACVNPAHLYEGTQQNNVDDAVSRQRHKRGDADPAAKLSDLDVLTIRTEVAAGAKLAAMAAKFEVTEGLISGIVRGSRWKHVGGPITKRYQINRKAA